MVFRLVRLVVVAAIPVFSAAAQSIDDGLMLTRRTITTGVVYSHESWDQYWEGTLKRSNGNIGTLTTTTVAWMAGYGVSDRIGLMAILPRIHTHASQGVLRDMSGVQDLTIGAKLRIFNSGQTNHGAISAFVVGTGAIPVSHYTPDFMPLSIGTAGRRAAARVTVNYQSNSALFATVSSAYTFCANVHLNRSSYYNDGQLYNTNEVAMPNVLLSTFTAGVARGRLMLPVTLTQQRTLGGSDIRRQDMPFVANRMDYVKLDAGAMYELPASFSMRVGAGHVLSGRNVGQATTFTTGLVYALHL
jgi:hypothetical protein